MSTLNVTNLKNEASASNNLTLDSNGRVGVGTSSPNRTFVVESASGPNLELRRTGFSNYTYIEDDGSNSVYRANGSIIFQTGGVNERARVTNNGITFNGDTAAANALDDYEEGSFTPVLQGSNTAGTTASGSGTYVKIGQTVTFALRFNAVSVSGGAGQIQLAGFPYAFIDAGDSIYPVFTPMTYGVTFNTAGLSFFYAQPNATYLNGLTSRSNDLWTDWVYGDWDNGTVYMNMSGTYKTAS